jgi:hypothetical protein
MESHRHDNFNRRLGDVLNELWFPLLVFQNDKKLADDVKQVSVPCILVLMKPPESCL